jgi:hypothetical protein
MASPVQVRKNEKKEERRKKKEERKTYKMKRSKI